MARKCDHWIKSYMAYTRHLEAPDIFHFWAGVATVAGALRGKCWIDMGYWSWKPNFFIIFVAPPGIATKSTTIGVGVELLRQVEGVCFGPDSCTWQGITDAFLESTETVTLKNKETVQVSCLTIAASELGTFLDPKNREMVDVMVDLWDGRPVPWKRRTKGEGASSIPNPWINFIGATTPAWLQENFPEYAIKGGFTSRTLFIFADHKRHFAAYPQRRFVDGDKLEKHGLVADLQAISQLAGPFELTPDAFEWGEVWYEKHWSKGLGRDDRLSGYLARKQTHLHKVAMIMSAATRDDMTITAEDLEISLHAIDAIEGPMLKVFSQVSDDPRAKHAQEILTILLAHKDGIPKRTLWRMLVHRMGEWHFENALTGLMNAGYLKLKQVANDYLIVPLEDKKDEAEPKPPEGK